jgi:hypothetical protein
MPACLHLQLQARAHDAPRPRPSLRQSRDRERETHTHPHTPTLAPATCNLHLHLSSPSSPAQPKPSLTPLTYPPYAARRANTRLPSASTSISISISISTSISHPHSQRRRCRRLDPGPPNRAPAPDKLGKPGKPGYLPGCSACLLARYDGARRQPAPWLAAVRVDRRLPLHAAEGSCFAAPEPEPCRAGGRVAM